MNCTRNSLLIATLCSATLLVTGCPSVTTPLPTPEEDPVQVGPVSFSTQIQPIFDAQCAFCHAVDGIAQASVPLLLTAGDSYAMLVGQPSALDASLTFVVASDSAASLLLTKVESSNPPVGSQMPLGGTAMSAADVNLIRTWIDEGALDN